MGEFLRAIEGEAFVMVVFGDGVPPLVGNVDSVADDHFVLAGFSAGKAPVGGGMHVVPAAAVKYVRLGIDVDDALGLELPA